MNVKYFIKPEGRNQLVFDIAGETVKEVFELLAEVQEIFEADYACGQCNCPLLQYRVRTVENNDFYEIVCIECEATLPLHQNRDGKGLYVERRDKKGGKLPKRGWKPPYKGSGSRETAYAAEDGR